MFEATSCGAFLITLKIDNGQPDLYREYEHIVTYETKQQLFESVEFYLAHEAERIKIAQVGQAHTLQDHTHDRRVEEMLTENFDRHSAAKRGRLRTA